jgi:DivIVA domain-containing protein
VADEVRNPSFPGSVRGYDRAAVDAYVKRVNRVIAELEVRSSPRAAVRHALEQVGEQTSGILQRAREAADEITTSARHEAEETTARAKAEAGEIVVNASTEADRVRAEAGHVVAKAKAEADDVLAEARRLHRDQEAADRKLAALGAERFKPGELDAHAVADESELAEIGAQRLGAAGVSPVERRERGERRRHGPLL